MDKIWEANASETVPTPGTENGYPSDGDIDSGTPATVPGAYWFWMITAELLALIVGAGLTPNGSMLNQVFLAVQAMAAEAQEAAIEAATTLATAAHDTAVATATTLANAAQAAAQTTVLGWFTGANQSLTVNGYQRFPGGYIQQRVQQSVPGAADLEVTFTYPVAFTSYSNIPIPSVQDPARAGDESNALLLSVISYSLTGCVIALGQNGGGARDVVLGAFIDGE